MAVFDCAAKIVETKFIVFDCLRLFCILSSIQGELNFLAYRNGNLLLHTVEKGNSSIFCKCVFDASNHLQAKELGENALFRVAHAREVMSKMAEAAI